MVYVSFNVINSVCPTIQSYIMHVTLLANCSSESSVYFYNNIYDLTKHECDHANNDRWLFGAVYILVVHSFLDM